MSGSEKHGLEPSQSHDDKAPEADTESGGLWEQRYRMLFENAAEAVFIAQAGRLLLVNDKMTKLCGRTAKELVCQPFIEFLHPDDRVFVMDRHLRRLQGDDPPSSYVFRIQLPNGEIRWTELCTTVVQWDGAPATLNYLRDITERKHAKEALEKSEQTYRLIFENAPVGFLHFDRNGCITACNDLFIEIIGSSRQQLIGLNMLELPNASIRAAVREALEGMHAVYEDWYHSVTGDKRTYVNIRFEPLRRSDGAVLGGVGIVDDMTARKQAEAERERLMSAVDQAAEAIFITDTSGAIEYVNPAFERITGYGREEVLERNPRMLKSGQHNRSFYDSMWQSLNRGETWKGRIVNRRKDGTPLTCETVISPVCDDTGRAVHYVAVQRDVSQEIALEEQLRQAQKMEAVGQLAGGVAHDFNNLLHVIIGFTEMTIEEAKLGPEQGENLQEVLRASNRAAALVSQLLAFSRKQVLRMQCVDLRESVADLLKILRRVIGEHITLEYRPGHDTGNIHADPGQIGQVLTNLCVNARDAMPKGGSIVLETRNVKLDKASCWLHPAAKPGRYVVLSVQDSGCGMDEETQARIFEPFFTTKEIGKGSGLGLSTVYGLVHQHQGFIVVQSKVAQGTTIEIYFPEVGYEVDPAGASEAPGPLPTGTETILLAEDEESVRDLTRAFLERGGYTVLTACNGLEALELFERRMSEIDLVLLDVVMPGMGGRQVYEQMRERTDVPVLFVSGYSPDAGSEGMETAAAGRLIQKPCSRSELLREVRLILDGEHSRVTKRQRAR